MGCVIIVLEEFKSKRIDTVSKALIVFCKAFEDNLGALELVKSPKRTPRVKYINASYHHFYEDVR